MTADAGAADAGAAVQTGPADAGAATETVAADASGETIATGETGAAAEPEMEEVWRPRRHRTAPPFGA